MSRPEPDATAPARYTTRPFPAYRFLPGKSPHPRRDPRGHSYGLPEPTPPRVSPNDWQASEAYLHGVDLYNYGFWWEAHEVFEALWHAAGHDTPEGRFFQALIHVAGANLKAALGNVPAAVKLAERALARLDGLPPTYMGLDVVALADTVRLSLHRGAPEPLRLALTTPPRAGPG